MFFGLVNVCVPCLRKEIVFDIADKLFHISFYPPKRDKLLNMGVSEVCYRFKDNFEYGERVLPKLRRLTENLSRLVLGLWV